MATPQSSKLPGAGLANDARPASVRLDRHRPRYHFLPPANWMNDPNGLMHWRGEYHLFYQHNPHAAVWGPMHWGHAVSTDLVHWTHLPIALAPTPDSPDQDGCWSGCAVDNDGLPTLIYTGVRGAAQLPCLATSTDGLRTWRKYPGNPVVPAPPPGLDLVQYRDPYVWREADGWYMLVGSGIAGRGGTALLYRSANLLRWDYLSPIYTGDCQRQEPVWTGSMWECPQLCPLGDKHLLVVSVWHDRQLHHAAYATGVFTNGRFTPETEGLLDYGSSFYAPQSLLDERGRRIIWGWLREGRDQDAMRAAGWSGVLSLPHILSPGPGGTVGVTPAPELAVLRGERTHLTALDVTPASEIVLPNVRGDCLEIAAEFRPGSASVFGLSLRRSPDGAEQTRIVYDRAAQRLALDTTQASLDPSVTRQVRYAPCPLAAGEPLRLRVFVDCSVLELFANDHGCLTERIYPTRPDSLGVALYAHGGTAQLLSLESWPLRSIWPDSMGDV